MREREGGGKRGGKVRGRERAQALLVWIGLVAWLAEARLGQATPPLPPSAGECELTVASSIRLGEPFPVMATCIPSISRERARLLLGMDSKASKARKPRKGKTYLKWEGSLHKGDPVVVSGTLTIERPGLWGLGVTLQAGGHWAKDHRYIYITHEESRVYRLKEMKGLVFRPTVSSLYIESPKDRGEYHLTQSKRPDGSPLYHERFVAYLPKEPRLDFEPVYRFILQHGIRSDPSGDWKWRGEPVYPPGKPTWWVEGNIGTIEPKEVYQRELGKKILTPAGLFTATAFGKGKVCAKHGILEDCLEVEVVPHPNPSPPETIVQTVVLPYDSKEEREWVKQRLKAAKLKKFKSKKDVPSFFFPPRVGHVQHYVFEEKGQYKHAFLEKGHLILGDAPKGKKVREETYLKKTAKVGEPVFFYSFVVNAAGEILTSHPTHGGPCVGKLLGGTCQIIGDLGEGRYVFKQPGLYAIGTTLIYEVE